MTAHKPYIIFLRGVMPMGKNKVPMAELRVALTKAGFLDVRTYIQSGNVLLRSDLAPAAVEQRVYDTIAKTFGGDIPAVARTPQQVRKIMASNPFPKEDTTRVYFTLLQSKPEKKKSADLESIEYPPDVFVLDGQTIYIHCPLQYGNTKLNNNFFERKLGVRATSRNYRTMTKVIELSK